MFNSSAQKIIRENRLRSINTTFENIMTQIRTPQSIIYQNLRNDEHTKLRRTLLSYQNYLQEENKILAVSYDHCMRVTDALLKLTSSTTYQDFQQNIDLFNKANEDIRYNLKAQQLGRSIVSILLPTLTMAIFIGLTTIFPPAAALPLSILGIIFGVITGGMGSSYAINGEKISHAVENTKITGVELHGIFKRVVEPQHPVVYTPRNDQPADVPAYQPSAANDYHPMAAPDYQSEEPAPPVYERGTFQATPTNNLTDIPEDPSPNYF